LFYCPSTGFIPVIYCVTFPPGYTNFVVIYNEVNQKLWFGNKQDPFTLLCDKIEDYSDPNNSQYVNCQVLPPNEISYCKNTKWGLPYFLGFNKEPYVATQTLVPLNNEYKNAIFDPFYNWLPAGGYYVVAPNVINTLGENVFYLDMFEQLPKSMNLMFELLSIMMLLGLISRGRIRISLKNVSVLVIWNKI
jgi:hypothetical protein